MKQLHFPLPFAFLLQIGVVLVYYSTSNTPV